GRRGYRAFFLNIDMGFMDYRENEKLSASRHAREIRGSRTKRGRHAHSGKYIVEFEVDGHIELWQSHVHLAWFQLSQPPRQPDRSQSLLEFRQPVRFLG